MPGDRTTYDQAMSAGAQAAWDQEWDRAIETYGRAVVEFPEDPAAHISLGLALLQAERLGEALQVYTRAHHLAPDDAIPLERAADILERLGRPGEASQNYVSVAEIYLGQRDVGKAISNWESAVRLAPGLLEIHSRLALTYERTGQRKSAIRQYLAIAEIFQGQGDTQRAIQACQRALRLDRNNPQVLNSLQALQAGLDMVEVASRPEESKEKRQPSFGTGPLEEEEKLSAAELKGPIGEAQETALAELATYLLDRDIATKQSGLFAAQGIDLQRAGDLDSAIAAYQHAKQARLKQPALHLNLGSLLVEHGDYTQGIKELKQALNRPNLAAGAHFAIGQAYMALGDQRQAAKHLLSALETVNLGTTFGDEVPEDQSIYDRMLKHATEMDPAQLGVLNHSLVTLMSGPEWRHTVTETRNQLEEVASVDGEAGLLEMLATDGTGRITSIMSRVDQYRRSGLLTLASDEAYYALEIASNYLPAHIRIAEILFSENRIRPAVEKYNMVAETYRVRGEGKKAAQILSNLLKLAPMDTSVRRKLIGWLEEEERWPEALEQYINLANAQYQLTDWGGAREAYAQAERLAQRVGASQRQMVHIMRRIGDIDVQRLELRQALQTYERIKSISPDDERARLTLIDLHYRVGNSADAIAELDDLLRLYAQSNAADKITQVLEEQVTLHPKEIALRSRLARVYQQQRRVKEAVAQLDALGELQLEAGRREDAMTTIQAIIAMNPTDREGYVQLLKQLGG
jgi:tetratricopeptide (TPR) repeat protein